MLDMLIQGGRVVTPAGIGDWDVGIVARAPTRRPPTLAHLPGPALHQPESWAAHRWARTRKHMLAKSKNWKR